MSKLLISLAILSILGLSISTTCKDGTKCPGTTTCCLTPRGVGCCPYENGNCCGDGLHCCPNGYSCDTSGGRCLKNSDANEFLTFLETTPAKSAELTPSEKNPEEPFKNLESPSIIQILKCLYDLKPVMKEIEMIMKDYKNGDMDGVHALLIKLAADGMTLGKDCWKVIEEFK